MKTHQIGDQPIELQYREQMNKLASLIDQVFNDERKGNERTTGFVLLTFDFGDRGRCNYISNAELADVIVLFKEQLARMEGRLQEGRA